MEQTHRPIRLLLHAQIVRRVDEVIASRTGGFTSREELIEEAVNSYLLELREVDHSSSGELPFSAPTGGEPRFAGTPNGRPGVPTSVSAPSPGFALEGDGVFVEEVPMLGLHNRDWPSLWALSRLAHAAAEGPVSFRTYLESVTEEAWQLSSALQKELGVRARAATQMLPTNVLKRRAAEAGFQNFAVGSVSNKAVHQGLHKAAGPLPSWRAMSFLNRDGKMQVALSHQGWELLKIVNGLGPEQPHNRKVAESFFEYLRIYSPSDWWGFDTVLRGVRRKPTRESLVSSMRDSRDWTPSIASSATQGYIARCREWGLIEPKLVIGTYRLTDFGKEILDNA